MNVPIYAANDWLSLSVGGLSFFGIGGGNDGVAIGGGSDFVIIMIWGGGDGFRQNPPFKIQIISSGESQTATM
ncbi:MAG TPA: hypothetical protein VNX46_10105 [Candidatus Acidoferrum sp.]|jgi:hypothetical protein|nr:hypothetical protein [Candidatus Acidoferrum sp.]